MKLVDCIQGDGTWLKARCGIPTASRFADIVTPGGKRAQNKAARDYQVELVGEQLTGTSHQHHVTGAMERGTELEPQARRWYEFETGAAVATPGFITSDCGRWGASPDGMTEKGGIEIKCLGRVNMLSAIINTYIDPRYMLQMQGCMWVTGRTTWDYVLFTDEAKIPNRIWTVQADGDLHAAFDEILPGWCDEVAEMCKKVKGMI